MAQEREGKSSTKGHLKGNDYRHPRDIDREETPPAQAGQQRVVILVEPPSPSHVANGQVLIGMQQAFGNVALGIPDFAPSGNLDLESVKIILDFARFATESVSCPHAEMASGAGEFLELAGGGCQHGRHASGGEIDALRGACAIIRRITPLGENYLERQTVWRTEDFKDLGGVARREDDGYCGISRTSNEARPSRAAESRREPNRLSL